MLGIDERAVHHFPGHGRMVQQEVGKHSQLPDPPRYETLLERHQFFEADLAKQSSHRPLSWRTLLYAPAAVWVLAFAAAVPFSDTKSSSVPVLSEPGPDVLAASSDEQPNVSMKEAEQIFDDVVEGNAAYGLIATNPLTKSTVARLKDIAVDTIYGVANDEDELSDAEYRKRILGDLADRVIAQVECSAEDSGKKEQVSSQLRTAMAMYLARYEEEYEDLP